MSRNSMQFLVSDKERQTDTESEKETQTGGGCVGGAGTKETKGVTTEVRFRPTGERGSFLSTTGQVRL